MIKKNRTLTLFKNNVQWRKQRKASLTKVLQWWNFLLCWNLCEAWYTSFGKSSHVLIFLPCVVVSSILNDIHDTWRKHLSAHSVTKPTTKVLILSTSRIWYLCSKKCEKASFGAFKTHIFSFPLPPNVPCLCTLYTKMLKNAMNRRSVIFWSAWNECWMYQIKSHPC